MPSWSVHLAIARKLDNELKLGDDFILGNVLPDVLNGYIIKDTSKVLDKSLTHFYSKDKKYTTDLDMFLSKYSDKFGNPIILGYYSHLLTDYFFNAIYHKEHTRIVNGLKYAVLKNGNINDTEYPSWVLKQMDFDVYGDYLIKNKRLGNFIAATDKTFKWLNDLEFGFTKKDIKNTISYINNLTLKDISDFGNMYIFTFDELNLVFDRCYEFILGKIKLTHG